MSKGHRLYFFANPQDRHIQALDWSLFRYEVETSLGIPDAAAFFEDHKRLFSSRNFLKRSIHLRAWDDPEEMRKFLRYQGRENMIDQVWATYHPQVRCKLGWYLIWIPDNSYLIIWGETTVERILSQKARL